MYLYLFCLLWLLFQASIIAARNRYQFLFSLKLIKLYLCNGRLFCISVCWNCTKSKNQPIYILVKSIIHIPRFGYHIWNSHSWKYHLYFIPCQTIPYNIRQYWTILYHSLSTIIVSLKKFWEINLNWTANYFYEGPYIIACE